MKQQTKPTRPRRTAANRVPEETLSPAVKTALRRSEERFRALIENASDMIVMITPDGNLNYVSPAVYPMTGYRVDEVVGRNIVEFIHADDLPLALQALANRSQNPGLAPAPVELRFRHKDGTWRIVEVLGSNLPDQPAVAGIVANVRDITERKQAELLLHDSEARYQTLARISPVGIFRTNPDGSTTYVNPTWCAISGLSVEEALGDGWLDAVHPDDKIRLSTGWQASTQLQQASYSEYRFVRPDGTIAWVIGQAVPEVNVEGQIIGYVGTITDITERKRAEIRYRSLFDQAHDAIFILSLEGRHLMANRRAADMLGYTLEEIQHLSVEDTSAQPEQSRQVIERLMRGEHVPLFERLFRRKDGSPLPVEINVELVRDADGQPLHILSVVRDITARKRVEEAMRQHLAELEALHTVSAAMRQAQTRDEALPILLDETLAALDTDAGAISLYHADSGELVSAVARGWFAQLDRRPGKPDEGIGGRVCTTGQAHLSAEFRTDPLTRASLREQTPPGWAGACVPIHSGAVTIGVLYVSVPLPRQITTEQMKLLESLAEMAGAALHRMRLFEETVRQVERLQALRAIDQAISGSSDLRITLNVVLEQAAAQLHVDAADVLLFNPHLQTLVYAAGRGFRGRAVERSRFPLGEGPAGRAALERRMIQHPDVASSGAVFAQAELLAAENVAAYYAMPLIVKGEVKGVLEIFHRSPLKPDSEWLNFLETLAGQAAIAIDEAQLFDGLQRSNTELAMAYDATIRGWSRALDLRDKETEGHTLRATEVAMQLAQALGIGEAELVHLRRGALLHDIGKMGVPDEILRKPGSLTEDEWKVMRLHPQLAYDMLSPINYLRPALDIPYGHHEKWDGTGYPRGLKGEQIPLAARLFAVVDVWDALRSDRPYRAAWPEERVREHIHSLRGTHFDPRVVEVFLNMQTGDFKGIPA